MEITRSGILLSILFGMQGCITSNLRAIRVEYSSNHIFLYFYYHDHPSEFEVDLAEEIATDVVADFPDIALQSFQVNKIVLPHPNSLPEIGVLVYHRYEV